MRLSFFLMSLCYAYLLSVAVNFVFTIWVLGNKEKYSNAVVAEAEKPLRENGLFRVLYAICYVIWYKWGF